MQIVKSIGEVLEKISDKKACLFDMDGLIFDTERCFMEQLSVVMAGYGYRLTKEIYCETLGLTGDLLRETMLRHYGEAYPFQRISRETRERVDCIAETVGLCVKPGIAWALKQMQRRGISCGLASSTRSDSVELYLELAGLRRYFSALVGGEMVDRCKPAPDIFLRAADALGVPPEDCAVWEDSENGVRAGKAAGCTTVCIPDMKQPRREYHQEIDYLVQGNFSPSEGAPSQWKRRSPLQGF